MRDGRRCPCWRAGVAIVIAGALGSFLALLPRSDTLTWPGSLLYSAPVQAQEPAGTESEPGSAAPPASPTVRAATGVASPTAALAPGDRVSITVADEPLWSGDYTIDEAGRLRLPRLEPIPAAGLPISQLAAQVTQALQQYVRDPVVSVNLALPVPRVVAALGGVQAPGTYDLAAAPTLLTLLASAGGPAPGGDIQHAVIIRADERLPVVFAEAEAEYPVDVLLQPNDALYVPTLRAEGVFVVGAVNQPGILPVTEAKDAALAVIIAGGPAAEANLRSAFVVRRGVRLPVDLAAVLAPEPAEPAPESGMLLEPGDVLVVPTAREQTVFVVGGVRQPGAQVYPEASRASKAVAMAGGETATADLANAFVLRGGQRLDVDLAAVLREGNPEADLLLQPGDAIVVPEVPAVFYVVGAVQQTGAYEIESAKTVLEAWSLSGGATPEADLWHAQLVRGEGTIPLDLYALVEESDLSQNQSLQPGDTLVVPRLKESVYVMGAVGAPGPQPIRPEDSLMDILGRAGGLSVAAKKTVFVYRTTSLRERDARLQLVNLATGRTKETLREAARAAKAGEEVEVLEGPGAYQAQPGDVIYVPPRTGGAQVDFLREILSILVYRGGLF